MFEIKKYLSSGLMFMHLPIPCLFNANSTFLYSLRAILVVAEEQYLREFGNKLQFFYICLKYV